jgi:predicted amidohydrolase
MSRRFLAAAVQFGAGSDKDTNLAKVERLARLAAERGAELIVLPEVFFWRGARQEEATAAEPIPGPTTERLAQLARDLRVHLVGGSILEHVPGDRRVFNTSTVFGPTGEMLGRYRKAHLFDVDIPGHVSIRESDTRVAGAEPVVVRTPLATLGLTICYDLRFPELYRRLTDLEAELICVPSAFTFATGALHWEILLRARAIENQVYVVAANQIGVGPAGFADFGHSLIVDPWGTPIGRATNGETVLVSEIDLDYLAQVRRELPCLTHRAFNK